ncbi:MAG TPA: metallophosphoesterase [Anaeromyxobacteraceae bacterium]|nr:metallophosphoesterase [Anaeromyxobacteraceae bacterium]
MSVVRISSDWHLGPGSPPGHGRLAAAFLARARRDGARVVLNGDVFDDLFAGPGRAEAAHPDVMAELRALEAAALVARTAGNHDPDTGVARVVLEVAGVGRVLVTHGNAVDPINSSPLGRLGDGISRRYGRTALVRGAAKVAEVAARAVAGRRMVEIFSRRCRAAVEREGFALGVFGHVHAAHLVAGDRYANAGWLSDQGLEYLELGPGGSRLATLRPSDLEAAEISGPVLR